MVAQPAVWFPVLTIAVLLALGTTFIIVYAADRNIFGLTIFNRTVSLLVVMFSFWAAKIILDNYYLYSQSWLVTFIEFIGVILVSLTLLMFNSYWYTVKLYRTYRIPVPVRKSLLTQNFVTFLTGSAIAIFVLVTLGWTPGLTGVKTGFLYVTILLTTVYLTKTYTTVSQLFSLNKKVNVLN